MIVLCSDWMASYCSYYNCLYVCMLVTLNPVLRDLIWDREKWSYKTGDLVKEVQGFL